MTELERAERRLLSQAKCLPDGTWIYGEAAIEYRIASGSKLVNLCLPSKLVEGKPKDERFKDVT